MPNVFVVTFIGIGWIVFWIYWIASAVGTKRNSYGGNWRKWVWVRIVIFLLVIIAVRSSHNSGNAFSYNAFFAHNLGLEILGTICFIVGLAFAIWARRHLGKNWGMPMSQKVKPELVTSGPYKYVRHPIYTGILTAGLGTALAVNALWIVITILAGAYFIYSATQEEKYMAKEFPKQYPEYKKHSKMLIPFIL